MDVLLVKGNVYDSVDDCVVAYMKYVAEAWFVVRRSCQKRLRNGDVKQKKKHVFDFSFDYLVENAELSGIFWADEVSKYNYKEFGDVVSFDVTFKINKYNMVFVPFTAIDNHRKCVTVVAGLLKNETTKSYIWLLKSFIKAFGKAPSIVVTGQDGAMRNAIEAEFTSSKHRLCMWNITQKLPAKILARCPNVEMIPQQYLLRRWTKNLIPAALRNKRNIYGEKNVAVENFANEATSIVNRCVHSLSKDEPKLGTFVEKLKSLKKEVEADCLNPPSKNKTDNLEQLVGVLKPLTVDVNNPTVASTKGQKKLRIKGGKEKAIEKSFKGRNSCSSCGGTDHNKRTCPQRLKFKMKLCYKKSVSKGSCGSKRSVSRGSCSRKIDFGP
nr:protein FAR1-related sequence 5 [Tanacetum cinerariifolium]